MVTAVLTREEFMQKYILMKASGKRPVEEILQEAKVAWEFCTKDSWKDIVKNDKTYSIKGEEVTIRPAFTGKS